MNLLILHQKLRIKVRYNWQYFTSVSLKLLPLLVVGSDNLLFIPKPTPVLFLNNLIAKNSGSVTLYKVKVHPVCF